MNIVITGKLDFGTRDDFIYFINKFVDITVQDSVGKNTDFLVTNETTKTRKYTMAQQYGVRVITEEKFLHEFI